VETVASFKRTGGRLVEGLDYDVAFNHEMNAHLTAAARDIELRRVLLYEYINSRILAHVDRTNVLVVRYERWLRDAESLRREISEFLQAPVAEWPATIRPPVPRSDGLTEREHNLIRNFAPSARELGYEPVH
jgi:hypothetical protein